MVFPIKGLDVRMWLFGQGLKVEFRNTGAIGIKHGIGLCGGIGHIFNPNWSKDSGMWYLKGQVREESFEFYKNYHGILRGKNDR